ncbi:hypothetical protein [Aquimarina sp. LLG6339-5]|uniref:hypothetical protein n=1 Tax=Aquimarina sp. LLG6339-5 TaxID=3160830 RepID=UPI0038679FD9
MAFLVSSLIAKADPFAYSGKVLITTESKNFIANHYHNWTSDTEDELHEMIMTDQNPFNAKNNYGYIELLDKKTGELIFKKPSTALTKIIISENEKHIVGISNIMVWNPYQLVVYNTKGILVKKRNFSSEESKLTLSQYDEFSMAFPKECEDLVDFTYFDNEFVYIDFLRMNMPKKLGKAWGFLIDYVAPNHLTPNIWETTTNYVYWFSEKNPEISLKYNNKNLISININDPKNEKFKIVILE